MHGPILVDSDDPDDNDGALMVITLCSCDWGFGAPIPAHEHVTWQLVRMNHREEWVRSTWFFDAHRPPVLAESEELILHVDWNALARQETMG